MTISGLVPIFAVGCFGGLLGELLKWYQLRESQNFPAYARSAVYWIVTLAVIAAGGAIRHPSDRSHPSDPSDSPDE